ncbi:hypothetical protein GPEL0_01r1164 [Geoanaerobacter pelophilus]|uniref:Uncharacterized protein n=1 Tax=Geoanaerobacter pelophilus TaxID=60036 RepID=A0ABQ0MG16_9BACT|nr:hypothetical protein GPEL0_01r1164 [Geoanaerobacter pelophilus]
MHLHNSPASLESAVSLENPQIIDLRAIFVKTFDRLSTPGFTLDLELSCLLVYISGG